MSKSGNYESSGHEENPEDNPHAPLFKNLSGFAFNTAFSDPLLEGFFCFHRTWKIKDLPGFKKNFHFIPDRPTGAARKFVALAALENVMNELETCADQLRHNLNLGAADYTMGETSLSSVEGGCADLPGGFFECSIFRATFVADLPDPAFDQPGNCLFTVKLYPLQLAQFKEKFSNIVSSFSDLFEFYQTPTSQPVDLEAFIIALERTYPPGDFTAEYSPYEYNSFKTELYLNSPPFFWPMRIREGEIRINFQNNRRIYDFIEQWF